VTVLKKLRRNRNRDSCEKNATGTENAGIRRIPADICNLGTMYTDLTGAFLVRSFKNMQYIFVVYIYDLNTIIVRPMPSRTDASFITAFTEVFNIL
jgi:hypothetical protein